MDVPLSRLPRLRRPLLLPLPVERRLRQPLVEPLLRPPQRLPVARRLRQPLVEPPLLQHRAVRWRPRRQQEL